jgi:GAF domain-containing protein
MPEHGSARDRARRENQTLYALIETVSSSLALDRVLGGIIEIATDATDCHACFVYFLEGDRLRLQAASPQYAGLVGRIGWSVDEGLTGWVARTRTPEFIRDNAMQDPRMKFVPELEEERFQSMVAVPLLYRSGEVIGVIVLHTVAPREFDDDALNFLVHTASLAAGAIENAKLYEETRRRVDALTTLTRLSQELAAVTLRAELHEVVTRGARELLGADVCQIWRFDAEADELVLAAADPAEPAGSEPRPGRAALLLDIVRHERSDRDGAASRELEEGARLIVAPLTAGQEHLGLLACRVPRRSTDEGHAELLQAVADQTAVGLKKTELIERLTAENTVKDMFEALAAGSVRTAVAKAAEARCDLARPHLFLHAERAAAGDDAYAPWPELAARLQTRLQALYARALFDERHDSLRALVPLPALDSASVEDVRRACERLGHELGVDIGLSDPGGGAASSARRMREAADAARIGSSLADGGGAVSYERLGAYRYLVNLDLDESPHDRYGRAVAALAEYDEERRANLVDTLERYLETRCSVAASARALYIHPNTVRQRLERIQQVTGLELAGEDLLSLELALKVARLQRLRAAGGR